MNSDLATFQALSKSTYKGVKGIAVFDSGISGPILGITICTHGNEPCGLSVANEFINEHLKPTAGKVIIAINNLKATENYLNASSEEEKRLCRFVDVNMNRLSDDLKGEGYEIQRSKELLPIWGEFDYALDIHSTAQPSKPMLIEGINDASHIMPFLPAELIIKNIIQTQVGTPAVGFYNKDCISIGYEAGSHEADEAQQNANACVKALLLQLSMLDGESIKYKADIFNIHSSIIFPDNSYQLSKTFKMYEKIQSGQVIAINNKNEKIYSPIRGIVLFPPKGLTPTSFKEEILFIAETN